GTAMGEIAREHPHQQRSRYVHRKGPDWKPDPEGAKRCDVDAVTQRAPETSTEKDDEIGHQAPPPDRMPRRPPDRQRQALPLDARTRHGYRWRRHGRASAPPFTQRWATGT